MVTKVNPLRADPTRSSVLRKKWMADFTKRYRALKGRILRLLVEEDVFGLKPTKRLSFNTRWRFNSDQEKVRLFGEWLTQQFDDLVLAKTTEEAIQTAYWNKYIEEGYRKGAGRAFDDVRKPVQQGPMDFFEGTKDEFLRSAFAQPIAIEKVKLLAARTLTYLKNVNDAMAASMKRVLMDGLVQGMGPREVARRMNKEIDTIGRNRARTIARTETVRAHAEGQLDALEQLGVTKIGVMVEWHTTGDDRVCPLCRPLEGIVVKVKEARGMLPRHPNCRCAYIPANVGEPKTGQVRSATTLRSRKNASILAEGKGSLKERLAKSKWAAADKEFADARPKAILDQRAIRSLPKKERTTRRPKPIVKKLIASEEDSLHKAVTAGVATQSEVDAFADGIRASLNLVDDVPSPKLVRYKSKLEVRPGHEANAAYGWGNMEIQDGAFRSAKNVTGIPDDNSRPLGVAKNTLKEKQNALAAIDKRKKKAIRAARQEVEEAERIVAEWSSKFTYSYQRADNAEDALKWMGAHETGHHLDSLGFGDSVIEAARELNISNVPILERSAVSAYATESIGESTAEIVAMYAMGKKDELGPTIRKLYERAFELFDLKVKNKDLVWNDARHKYQFSDTFDPATYRERMFNRLLGA